MEALAAAGVNSFKFFMAYKGILQVTDEQLLRGFAKCRQLGALPQVCLRQGRTNPSWTWCPLSLPRGVCCQLQRA